VSLDAENTMSLPFAALSGVGVSLGAFCSINGNGIATFEISGGGTFSVSGTYNSVGVTAVAPTSGDPQQLTPGTSLRDDNNQAGIFEINASTTGEVSADLLVTSGGSVASVQVFLAGSTTTHCEARGVGIPTG
jgi:hypothetical protein